MPPRRSPPNSMSDAAASPRLEFETLHDAPPLKIEASPGTSRRLMVSFASVGKRRDALPEKEFVGSISQDGRNHIITISDSSRSWMNADGMASKVRDVISDYVLGHHIRQIVAIGTSMGAYCALVLGKLMPLDRIIAFTPQYSVHPEIMPDEDRWMWFRKQITNWRYPTLDTLPGGDTVIYMFHGDSPAEQMHWTRFPEADNLKHYILKETDHNFIGRFKKRGVLAKMVVAAIHDRPGRMEALVERFGAMSRADYRDYSTTKAIPAQEC